MSLVHHLSEALHIERSQNIVLNRIATTYNTHNLSITNLLSLNDFNGISVSYSHYITLSGLIAEKGVKFIQCKFSNIQVKGTNKALHVGKSSVLSVKM